jgi:hypothetical protein
VSPAETPDGIIATFTLPQVVPQQMVFVDGALVVQGVDYTISGAVITFVSPATTARAGAKIVAYASTEAPFDVVEAPAETPNGVRTTFTLSRGLIYSLQLYVEGMLQMPGVDYSISGANIVFLTSGSTPRSGAVIRAHYNLGSTAPMFRFQEVPGGTADASNPTFTLTYEPLHLQLFVDRVFQVPGLDYTIAGTTITFLAGAIPRIGAILWANYSTVSEPFNTVEIPVSIGAGRWRLGSVPFGQVWVYVDRALQIPGRDYTMIFNQITFLRGAIPAPGAIVRVCSQAIAAAQSVTQVFAINWRTVRCKTSVPPDSAQFPTIDGDALNPSSWVVQVKDTAVSLTPVVVTKVDATTFDISTVERLPSHVNTITAGFYGAIFSGVPQMFTLDVQGITWREYFTPAREEAQRRRVTTDLANAPTNIPGSSNVGGTLTLQGGDYINATGAELVRKLIYRRLSTPKGAFTHLPNYGLGLLTAKSLFQPNDLIKLRAEIERQVKMEPEVATVRARISLSTSGTLYISVTAVLVAGGPTVEVSLGGT